MQTETGCMHDRRGGPVWVLRSSCNTDKNLGIPECTEVTITCAKQSTHYVFMTIPAVLLIPAVHVAALFTAVLLWRCCAQHVCSCYTTAATVAAAAQQQHAETSQTLLSANLLENMACPATYQAVAQKTPYILPCMLTQPPTKGQSPVCWCSTEQDSLKALVRA